MKKVKTLKLYPIITIKESDELAGKMVTNNMVETLIDFDCDLYDAESGNCLAKFRKNVIPSQMCVDAYNNLKTAAMRTDSRPTASGADGEEKASQYRVRKDGQASKQTVSKSYVYSGVIGHYDRSPRHPFCRTTAFTMHEGPKYAKGLPLVRFVDAMYKKLMPKEYKLQRAMADKTAQDFVIKGTSFTTVTVNKNYSTAIHKDAGDFKDGFGNLVALRKGEFEGNYLTLPRWGVGFDLRNGDLLLMDVHQWHGNTPMLKHHESAVRLSLVMYYRENMIYCDTAKNETKKAQKRVKGTKLIKA